MLTMPHAPELALASLAVKPARVSTSSTNICMSGIATSRAAGFLAFKAQCKSAVALVQERRIDFVRAQNVRVIGRLDGTGNEPSPPTDANRDLTSVEAVEKVLVWHQSRKIGPGFANLGNTCYLNSVLQCLTYTPCFAQLVGGKDMFASTFDEMSAKWHTFGNSGARDNPGHKFCSMRAMSRLLQLVHGHNALRVVQPKEFVMNVRHLSKRFRIGRQEDSHEFFRLLLDSLHRSCLRRAHVKRESHAVATTSLVYRIFGGKLKNCLQCAKCRFLSERYDDFLDLSLEIATGVNSVLGALRHFTATEKLDDRNAWTCSHCGHPSRAEKSLSLAACPNVLMIQLKRFDVLTGKIQRHVAFPLLLDIAPGMSQGCYDLRCKRTKYELHAVIVHAGWSTECGHYVAFVKGSSGQWYEMNDDSVRWVRPDTVLQQSAYMLFYSRILPPEERRMAKEEGQGKDSVKEATYPKHELVASKTVVRTVKEMDVDGLSTRLETPATDATDGGVATTGGHCNPQLKTVVTFRVTKVAHDGSQDVPRGANQRQCLVSPSFGGRLGRVYRFDPALWTNSPRLAMKQIVVELRQASHATNVAIASDQGGAPVNVPFDPKSLGRRGAALFGREVEQWTGETDVESVETTSDEAVDKALAAHHDRVLNTLRQEEWAHRTARRPDFWDETLDTGKVKRVNKRKDFVPNQGRQNAFQQTLMRQQNTTKRQRYHA